MSTGVDVSRLAPSDCVAALRSYPRRYRAAIAPIAGDDAREAMLGRAGADGRTPLELVDHVARSVALLGHAVDDVLLHESPVVPEAVVDDDAREWAVRGGALTSEGVLDFLTTECQSLADRAERVDAEAWTRTGTVAGRGAAISAIDVLREAVRVGADELRALERLLAEL